ncbi:MAG: ORF6N domain-containing protein [Candidatus Omnitrophica bacterium]|nr:ORF6N domain-containing protein [Candidatus Omnitrophota bacterium]
MVRLLAIERIENKIFQIRGKKVMLDRHLSQLYSVKPIALRQQVKRNKQRFPEDFMFRVTKEEARNLVSQNVIPSKRSLGGYLPYVFTEQGVAMLSSVLSSERAIHVNIAIMRTFVNLRRMALTYAGLKRRIEAMEKKYDAKFKIVFEAFKKLLEPRPVVKKRKVGFHD